MTRRPDLLALTPDDLSTLANRGLVKRAQKDLESGNGPDEFDVDDAGAVTARWPDGAAVTLAPGAVLNERCCTCAAFTICRHIIGTVFTYQVVHDQDAGESQPAPPEAWDPGAVSDAVLEPYWPAAVWASIQKAWQAGVVAEVHRSAKPLARLYSSGVTLRFLVAHDVRYVQCDCAEDSPCRHVPLAVWAFRELTADRKSALVAANQPPAKAPVELKEECAQLVANLFHYGAGELPPTDIRTWEGLAPRLRRSGLIWPEQIVLEWLGLRQQYLDRDARFDATELIQRSGELLIRMRAICANTGSVPQLFLRGAREENSELGSARLVGLGTSIAVQRKSVWITSTLQDVASGALLTVRRETAGHAKTFHELSAAYFAKKFSFADAGSGQMLVKGAKRSINGELTLGRAAAAMNPQSFEWEKLRAPVLVEGVDELRSHLDNQPPASLRPRHVAENFHVFPVGKIADAGVDAMSRRLRAVLQDPGGEPLLLEFPYYSQGRSGFAALHEALKEDVKVRFVSGVVRASAQGLAITPSALILESGSTRRMLQPWVDPSNVLLASLDSLQDARPALEAFAQFRIEILNALGEAALTGISNADPLMERRWAALIQQGGEIGLSRFLAPAIALHESIQSRRGALGWDAAKAVNAAVQQAVLAVFGEQ